MQNGLFIHESVREYVYPVSRNKLMIKLKSLQRNGTFFIQYCNRFHESECNRIRMQCRRRDEEYDWLYAEIELAESVKYIRYFFENATDETTTYYGADGMVSDKPRHCFEYLYTNELDVFVVPEWAEGTVVYEIFPDRFCNGDKTNDPDVIECWGDKPTRNNFFGGDLRGIISKLDHISELGANCLYLTPVFKSPSNHKYDTEDYYRIDPAFGDMEAMKELVKASHERGIRVVLDGVFNHCGFTFPPFQDVLECGRDSKYADWFYLEGFPIRTNPQNYECVGYYSLMPKIRMSNRDARAFFLKVGTYWIEEADIDGWRLDVADEVDFTFWQEFRRAVKAVKKDAILIGETWKDGRDLLRGDQMDSVMNYLFRNAVIEFFAEQSITSRQFDYRIQKMLSIYPEMVYSALFNLLGSHDTPRILTLFKGDIQRMKLAVAFQMTFPGMPVVYYGDELSLAGDNDPDCRRTMDWENGDYNLFCFYKQMIAIRRSCKAFVRGSFYCILCEDGVYGYARRYREVTFYILLNNSKEEKRVTVPLFESGPLLSQIGGEVYTPSRMHRSESVYDSQIVDYQAELRMALPAYHFEILKQGGIEYEKLCNEDCCRTPRLTDDWDNGHRMHKSTNKSTCNNPILAQL